MPMHIIIQEKRKELGLTQEQVADYLGVSAPAVSKWEKGTTSPDISLLPALARLLKIDLNTLFGFHEDLTIQEIGQFCNEIVITGRSNAVKAFEMAEAKVHEFPHNEELLLQVTLCLDAMLLQAELSEQEKAPMDEQIVCWYSHLQESQESKISNTASYMMVSRYIRQEKLDLAQQVLDTIPDKEEMVNVLPDKLMLQVSIYLKENKADLAALELERALYRAVNKVQILLYKLVDAELSSGQKDIAEEIARRSQSMTELFDLWKYTGYVAPYQLAATEQNADQTLRLLTEMLKALVQPWDISASPLFHRMSSEVKQTDHKQILATLLRALETDNDCEYLRGRQGYQKLVDCIKKWIVE